MAKTLDSEITFQDVQSAIRESLALDKARVVSRNTKLIDLEPETDRIDMADMSFKLGIPYDQYCQDQTTLTGAFSDDFQEIAKDAGDRTAQIKYLANLKTLKEYIREVEAGDLHVIAQYHRRKKD